MKLIVLVFVYMTVIVLIEIKLIRTNCRSSGEVAAAFTYSSFSFLLATPRNALFCLKFVSFHFFSVSYCFLWEGLVKVNHSFVALTLAYRICHTRLLAKLNTAFFSHSSSLERIRLPTTWCSVSSEEKSLINVYFQHFQVFILFAFLYCHCTPVRAAWRNAREPIFGAGCMAFWI